MSSSTPNGTIVLVHGAWADGSCWQNIILPLRRRGLAVTSAPIPLTSLTDDVRALERTLERTNGPVVLVGHAYAGAVIAATREDRVKSLVYVAGLAPDEGETVAEVFYRAHPHPEAPQLAPDAHGFIWMPEDGFRRAVAHKASPDQTTIMAAVQRPIAVKCIQEKCPTPAWKTKPSWFLVAEKDRMISPETQHLMAGRMGANVRLHSVDHSPMYTAPNLVVDVIAAAANETLRDMHSSTISFSQYGSISDPEGKLWGPTLLQSLPERAKASDEPQPFGWRVIFQRLYSSQEMRRNYKKLQVT